MTYQVNMIAQIYANNTRSTRILTGLKSLWIFEIGVIMSNMCAHKPDMAYTISINHPGQHIGGDTSPEIRRIFCLVLFERLFFISTQLSLTESSYCIMDHAVRIRLLRMHKSRRRKASSHYLRLKEADRYVHFLDVLSHVGGT